MALTPEEVMNQKFTITKFRDGYDLDQVDDFLDVIVEELRQHEAEKEELRSQLEAANARVAELEARIESGDSGESTPASEQTIVVDAPQPAAPSAASQSSPHEADAIKSSAMLQLALELHDKYISDGETRRDEIISEAESRASQLVREAEDQRAEELRILSGERDDFSGRIKELREFESEYRSTLRSYIQSQLRNLDGSPEPDGAPSGLN